MRLFALRGATSVAENDASQIRRATAELMGEILARNAITPQDAVSCLFTTTEDLNAEFPAAAARECGFEAVPLICAREIAVPGSMPLVIRVLMHYYADERHTPHHVYLREAVALRSDLANAPQ